MKNVINHFYNLYPEKLYENNGIYYFYIEDIKFYFVPLKRTIEELNVLVDISNKLYNDGIMVHTFIMNIEKTFYITYNEENYVLLRVNSIEKEDIELEDIVNFNNYIVSDRSNILYTEDWVSLWSNKVDVFESQMLEFNKEFILLTESFNYYIGLAENAISYAKNAFLTYTEDEKDKLCLSHRRITAPIIQGNLYNPLSFIFDFDIRDIAEYIKAKFFNNEFIWEEIEDFFSKVRFSNLKLNLLYARLLYPTYYFDLFERIIYGEVEEKEIVKITHLSESYERFLFDIYLLLKKYSTLPEIEWIVDKYS